MPHGLTLVSMVATAIWRDSEEKGRQVYIMYTVKRGEQKTEPVPPRAIPAIQEPAGAIPWLIGNLRSRLPSLRLGREEQANQRGHQSLASSSPTTT